MGENVSFSAERPVASFSPGDAEEGTNARKAGATPLRSDAPKQQTMAPSAAGRKEIRTYLDWVTSQPYCREAFAQGARLGTEALAAAGGWEPAIRLLREEWEARPGADNFVALRGSALEGLVPEPLLKEARENAQFGIEACVTGLAYERVRALPHPSLKGYIDEAGEQLWKDCSKGRVLLAKECPQLEGVVSAPLARVPKRNPDRTLSTKGRLIWDARRVNTYCSKEQHPPALQPKHAELTRLVLWWTSRLPGLGVKLAKKDTSEAFKWVPITPADSRFFAADLPGAEFGLDSDVVALYRVLTFGLLGGGDPRANWHDSVPFATLILMDDAVLVEPEVGLRPYLASETLETLTRTVLGNQALNADKDWEEGGFDYTKIVWGLQYNTIDLTRSLPAPKLEKAAHLLALEDFDRGRRIVALRLVQELRGNQQFWLSAMPVLSGLLSATNALLGPATPVGDAVPQRATAAERERNWVRFWDAIEVQRYLVGVREDWATTFTHPMVSALTLRELLAMPQNRDKVVWASGDATLDRVAAIDWTAGLAFSLPADSFREPLLSFVAEATATPLAFQEGAEDLAFEPSPGEKFIVAVTETYHNLTADALTREDPQAVMQAKGLEGVPGVAEFVSGLLARGWLKRAFLWGAQHDTGRDHALRVAVHREGTPMSAPVSGGTPSLLDLRVLEWDGVMSRYARAFASSGAEVWQPRRTLQHYGTQWTGEEVDLVLCSLVPRQVDPVGLARGALRARAKAVWADALTQKAALDLKGALESTSSWRLRPSFGREHPRSDAGLGFGSESAVRSAPGHSQGDLASEVEQAMLLWPGHRQSRGAEDRRAGGPSGKKGQKSKKGKSPKDREVELSKAMSQLLRHAAGTGDCPITEDGWVRAADALHFPRIANLGVTMDELRAAVRNNSKARITWAEDSGDGAGHSISGVTGAPGIWAPKPEPSLTEAVAEEAPPGSALSVDVDTQEVVPLTQGEAEKAIEEEAAEAASDLDWSADESDYEITQAEPGELTAPRHRKVTGMILELESPEARGSDDAPPVASSAEPEEPKEGTGSAKRRRVVFGSANILLMASIAEADQANWRTLSTRLAEAQGTSFDKAELVERLGQLAEARRESKRRLDQTAQDERKRLSQISTEQEEYLAKLSPALRQLEEQNPVGPRQGVPLLTTNRLTADIEAGTPVWVARRRQRARERAAAHQAAQAAGRELREFRRHLLQEGSAPQSLRRQPDSKARKKRRREARRNKARSSPGASTALVATVAASAPSGASALKVGTVGLEPFVGLATLIALVVLLGLLGHAVARFAPGRSFSKSDQAKLVLLLMFSLFTVAESQPPPGAEGSGRYLLELMACLVLLVGMVLGCTVSKLSNRSGPTRDSAVQTIATYLPAEGGIKVTPSGERFHLEHCGHVRNRRGRILHPCLDCAPLEAQTGTHEPVTRAPRGQRRDEAKRDNNHPYAQPSSVLPPFGSQAFLALAGLVLLLLGMSLFLQGCTWNPAGFLTAGGGAVARFSPGFPREAVGPSGLRRVGVQFDLSQVEDSGGEARTEDKRPTRPRKKSSDPPPGVTVPFLGGPKKTLQLMPKGATHKFAIVQGRDEWAAETLSLLLARLADSTRRTYASQWRWWELFCGRRQLSPWRRVVGYDPAEEDLFVQFVVHCGVNFGKAPGTVKSRLAAVRAYHLTAGLPDPTANMPKVTLAIAGLKKRYGTKERRRPVTPAMLKWLHAHLWSGALTHQEASLQWASVSLAFFFLLRASEYLDAGYKRGMRGEDVRLFCKGIPCKYGEIGQADEVSVTIRGSKTDVYNRGEVRNHYRTGLDICPVQAAVDLFRAFPLRYHGAAEASEFLFRDSEGSPLPRAVITVLLRKAAAALGEPEGTLGTHSLRFGGASALWSAFGNASIVKRYGRWTSESFQTYLWDSREDTRDVARRMAETSLAPR
ncbi:unnamed protein product [Symbiodinium sp. CCMP2592]|nr:unnamed protein product [Symbiodinium sp. CCMP2592]